MIKIADRNAQNFIETLTRKVSVLSDTLSILRIMGVIITDLLALGHYQIKLTDCPMLITDPETIKQEMERFNFTGDLGYYNQTAELKK